MPVQYGRRSRLQVSMPRTTSTYSVLLGALGTPSSHKWPSPFIAAWEAVMAVTKELAKAALAVTVSMAMGVRSAYANGATASASA